MITRFSIVTLVFFFLSTIFVIHPVSFRVRLPYVGRKRITIGLMTAPILAIAILWASQCLGGSQIRNGIVGTDGIKPYNILLLFISLAYMAITLDITGVLQAAAFWVSNKGGTSGRKLFLYFYILLTAISMVIGNDPIILSGTAFLVYYTAATGLEPVAWLISEFASANTASMVLFVGNPTNVVICEGFFINNAAFTAYTILPFIACSVACFVALTIQFRKEIYIPKKMQEIGQLNPRQVLLDPVGAIFGTILFVTCLVVIIALSFFHVDVYKVSLPFAGAKVIFDIVWDHYRFKNGRLPKEVAKDAGPTDETSAEDYLVKELKRAVTMPHDTGHASIQGGPSSSGEAEGEEAVARLARVQTFTDLQEKNPSSEEIRLFPKQRAYLEYRKSTLAAHFPTFFTALPRLPFGLIPFAFSQFILIEALSHQGWIDVFAGWLVKATHRKMFSTIWIIGVLGVLLCNVAGTNIGATILLTKIVRAAPNFPPHSTRAAGIALAVASNIGAVSFTFSASLAGLLWQNILRQKGITVKQATFAFWNLLPLLAMTAVGLAIVSAEMAVLY